MKKTKTVTRLITERDELRVLVELQRRQMADLSRRLEAAQRESARLSVKLELMRRDVKPSTTVIALPYPFPGADSFEGWD